LLVNIGVAGSLGSFPFARVVGLNVPFSLPVRLGFFRLLPVFVASTGPADAVCNTAKLRRETLHLFYSFDFLT